jgi:hypothetical protein
MLHPLALDLFLFLLPLCVGALTFACGYFLAASSRRLQAVVIVITLLFIMLAAMTLAGIMPFWARDFVSALGGGTVVMCCAAMIFLGFARGSPQRKASKEFLAALILIVAAILIIECGGRLWWRFGAAASWQRTVNANGCLVQSTRWTCSPAAGVMLLHNHGVPASEGEMAYLANTTLFGTDGLTLACALTEKVRDRAWHAELHETDYQHCCSRGKPFVAHISSQETGAHAVFVSKISADHVEVVDPLVGWPTKMSRESFQAVWDGTAIWIETGQE